jgi:hypothetical protein
MKYIKLCFRLLLGLFMTYAGYSHLTHLYLSSSLCGQLVAGATAGNCITIGKTSSMTIQEAIEARIAERNK